MPFFLGGGVLIIAHVAGAYMKTDSVAFQNVINNCSHTIVSSTVRTALVAMIAFMPTASEGALGSLDYPPEDRQDLARRSVRSPPSFSDPEMDAVAKRLFHGLLDQAVSPANGKPSEATEVETDAIEEAEEADQRVRDMNTNGASLETDAVTSASGRSGSGDCESDPSRSRSTGAPRDAGSVDPSLSKKGTLHANSIGSTDRSRQHHQTDVFDMVLQFLIYSVGIALVAVIAKKFIE